MRRTWAAALSLALAGGCALVDGLFGDAPAPPGVDDPDGGAPAPDGAVEPPARWFLSPDGSDARPCDEAQPCRTFDHVYQLAEGGDVVAVGPGTYVGRENILAATTPKASSERVLFRPAAGGATIQGLLDVEAQHLELRSLTVTGGWNVDEGSADVILRGVTSGMGLFIGAARDVQVIGGSVTGVTGLLNGLGGGPPTDVSFVGVDFLEILDDCLTIDQVDGLVMDGCSFRSCADGDVRFTGLRSSIDVRITNSFFAGGDFAVRVDGANFELRHNSSTSGVLVASGGSSVLLDSNILDGITGCTGISARFNVITGPADSGCGGATEIAAPGAKPFVDPDGGDLHLLDGPIAVDLGDPSEAAGQDFDGDARPQGAAPDVGADELR